MNKTLTIVWGEIKKTSTGKRLFEGSFKGEDGKEFNASIWEMDRDNKQFPGFNDLRPGATFVGNPWNSPTNGKCSIYPPKAVASTGGASRGNSGANAMKVQDRIEKSVEKTLDTKEVGIKLSSAMSNAILLARAEVGELGSNEQYKNKILDWRRWILDNWGSAQDVKSPW